MTMRFFQSVTTAEELKKEYRKLAKKFHPDQGGNANDFIQLKEEYEERSKRLNDGEFDASYMKLIDAIVQFDGINIEIIGTWVWVTGETYPVRKKLKELEMRFSKKKGAWYWYEGEYKKKGKKQYSLDDIRNMHERQIVKKSKRNQYLAN